MTTEAEAMRPAAYVNAAISTFADDPPNNDYQRGYLAALEVVRREAFRAGACPDLDHVADAGKMAPLPSPSPIGEDVRAHLADVSAISEALGLFPSVIRSGEAWSPTCEATLTNARDALSRLAARALNTDLLTRFAP